MQVDRPLTVSDRLAAAHPNRRQVCRDIKACPVDKGCGTLKRGLFVWQSILTRMTAVG